MFTANIVDTSIFRSLGKPSNPQFKSLKNAVDQAGTELWVPAPIYRELTDYGTDPPVNPYLDDGVEDGWIRVAIPLAGVSSHQVKESGESPRCLVFYIRADCAYRCR